MKAFILLIVGLESLLIFDETHEVSWAAGIPLALGSATGAYIAAWLATKDWARVWVYRLLVLLVVLAIVHLLTVDNENVLQHARAGMSRTRGTLTSPQTMPHAY